MAVKRRSFAQMRKAAGYTQESLAERLGVDRTTVARWEAGEYSPQPWLRPRIAQALGLPLSVLSGLLNEVEALGPTAEAALSPSPVETPTLPSDVRTLFNELAAMASVPGVTWEEFMRWLSRRLVLKQGFAATLVPVLGLDAVTRHPIERPLILAAPSCALWANPIYEAVLSPTDAARRAALELEMSSADSLDSLRSLRQAAAAVMRAELSSDYTQ